MNDDSTLPSARWFWPDPVVSPLTPMKVTQLSDADLIDDIGFCRAVMDTDSEVTDIWLEFEDGTKVTYVELLSEAARRAIP